MLSWAKIVDWTFQTFLLDKHYNNSLESFRIIIIVLYKCRTNLYRETIWAITAINIKKKKHIDTLRPIFRILLDLIKQLTTGNKLLPILLCINHNKLTYKIDKRLVNCKSTSIKRTNNHGSYFIFCQDKHPW